MKTRFVLSILFFALAEICVAQNLVTNPGFETGNFAGWTPTAAPSGSLLTVVPTSFDTGGSGSFIARFGATNLLDDQLSQMIATAAGQTYTLSFFIRIADVPTEANFVADGFITGNHMSVMFGGVTVYNVLNANPGFATFTFPNLSPTGNSTNLSFFGYGREGIFIDNVSVTLNPVPETGSTIVLLGCACAGMLAARRRRS